MCTTVDEKIALGGEGAFQLQIMHVTDHPENDNFQHGKVAERVTQVINVLGLLVFGLHTQHVERQRTHQILYFSR